MTRLSKVDQPIFAGNNSAADEEIAVFGTMKTSAVYSMDLPTLYASAEYKKGWQESVVVGYAPFLEELNGVQYGLSYQIAYIQQEGIPEWSSGTEYYTGSLAKLVDNGNALIYVSKVDNNIGNLVSDNTKWKLWLNSSADYVQSDDIDGAASTILSSDFPLENQNKVLWSATTGKVGTYPYFDANKLQYLNSITSDVQTQLNGKQATITGAASSVVSSNVSGDKALVSNASGKIAASSTTSTELEYVHGVTGKIQDQLNSRPSVTAYSKSHPFYIKFSNGLIIQWGQVSGGSSDNTVPLPTAFSTANYFATAQYIGNQGQLYQNGCYSLTTTSFKIHSYGGNISEIKKWFAIGW